MQTPLRITFRHMSGSAAVETRVREYMERLERFHGRITSCHVVIDAPAAHRHKGAPFTIKIDLALPGRALCVDTERAETAEHTDVYVALRDAFDSLKRLLQDHTTEQRASVRHNGTP